MSVNSLYHVERLGRNAAELDQEYRTARKQARVSLCDAMRAARPTHSMSEIARAAGITRQRVHQLLKEQP